MNQKQTQKKQEKGLNYPVSNSRSSFLDGALEAVYKPCEVPSVLSKRI